MKRFYNAESLNSLRSSMNLNIATLANALGVSEDEYLEIENGSRQLTHMQLRTLSTKFNIPPSTFANKADL